jgi:hypothetical protein
MCRRVRCKRKCPKAAAATGLPSGDAEWEHELIGQVAAHGDAGCQIFIHFIQRFVGDLLSWNAATAYAGEDFGDTPKRDFKD